MAITKDTTSSVVGGSATSLTWAHTVGTGSNTILVVAVRINSGTATVTGVTYNAVSMTQLTSKVQGSNTVYLFYILLGTTTSASHNIVASFSATVTSIGVATSYFNVAQSGTWGTAATSSGASGNSSNTVTTTSSSQEVVDINYELGTTDATAGASQTKEVSNGTSALGWLDFGDIAATGSSMSLSWTNPTNTAWIELSAAMNVAGTQATKSLGVRLRLAAQKIVSAGVRLRLATKSTQSLGMRLHLTTGIQSGGYCLYANGTGVASFTDFRVTASPDPALALEPVGRLGSSFVSWNAILPSPATTLGMYTSLRGDGSDWFDVSAQSGGPIPGLYGQPDPTIDGFGVDSHMNYTATNQTGGAAPTATYDTAKSRVILTGGNNGLYLYNSIARADIDELAIMDTADAGGLVWRFVDANNFYCLVVSDHLAAVGTPQRATLYSVKAGVQTQLAQATIPFVRSTFHIPRVTMLGGVITATWDGAALFSYTDSSPLGAGNVGLFNNGGATGSRYYQLWIQPQGDLLLNTYVYTKEAPATTDATVTPQLLDMTVAAFNPNIGPGALIPAVDYRHQFMDKVGDDLVKQSVDYSWYIDQNFQFYFRKRTAIPAPWALYSLPFGVAAAVDLEADSNLQVTVANDLYRNRQTLTGVINSGIFSDTFIGDGSKQSFTLRYPVAPGTIPTILLNNNPQSVALKGQSGAQWYYTPGDAVLAQDTGGVVLISTDTLSVPNYTGTFLDTITVDNVAAQQAMAATMSGTGIVYGAGLYGAGLYGLAPTSTGIVENVEDVSSRAMSYASGLVYAGQLLARWCINNARTMQFTTLRTGLQVGMIQSVFVPEENLWDAQMLITAIDPITIRTQPGDTIQYNYLVTASELPPIASWSKLFGSGLLLS